MKKILALFLTLFPIQAFAWWESGHMLTAQIAYDNLQPEVKEKVDELCKNQGKSPHSAVRFDEAADWMDAIKTTGLHAFDSWHYMSIPYNPTGYRLPAINQPQNARWAVLNAIKILKNPQADELEKSFMLRVLTHVAGDLHQPLHVISMYSDKFPEGDDGANLFKLPNVVIAGTELNELHAAWDYSCGAFPQFTIDEDERIYKQIPGIATSLQQEWPMSKFADYDLTTNVDTWINGSLMALIENVYNFEGKSLVPGKAPSEAYFENCRKVCKRQIALGGYRLAALLNDIFGKNKGP